MYVYEYTTYAYSARVTHHHLTAVLTLCACTPPLDEVLQLWDFLLAFGVHLNVLCVIAQLLLMREAVMESSRCVFRLRCPLSGVMEVLIN